MIILGDKEKAAGNISVRAHQKGDIGTFELEQFKEKLSDEIKNKKHI